jgi:PKD repeat protein
MKFYFSLLLVATFVPSFISIKAQTNIIKCATDEHVHHMMQEDPALTPELFEEVMEISDGPMTQSFRSVKYVPVVVHVIHSNGVGDIDYEQIESAIDMLNEDFRRLNSDASQTRTAFQPYAADSEVEFGLAKVDPSGQCTNGVVRVNNPSLSFAADDAVKSLSYWPSDEYFNIWVVNEIDLGFGGGGIILGYAQFPGFGSWSTYGVVIRHDRMGRIGTAGFGDRTLTHEVGHCFNLSHTFQSGCGSNCNNSGDRVCDTPPSAQDTYGCNFSQNTCSNDQIGSSFTTDMPDQIENYMSYDDCQNMFSLGQKTRMINALNGISQLISLTSPSNVADKDILNPNPGVCKADFEVDRRVVCENQIVQYNDQSYFNPITHNWSFTGGDPITSTLQNPSVTYAVAGVYDVSLSVGDNTNVVSNFKQDFMTVLEDRGSTSPVTEDFEFTGELRDNGWFVDNEATGAGWFSYPNAGSGSTRSMYYNAHGNGETKFSVESSTYDLSNLTSGQLDFDYAYRSTGVGSGELGLLRLYISTDCGQNWALNYINAGAGLQTGSNQSWPFTFPSSTEWTTATMNIPGVYLREGVRFKFEFDARNTNNLFIDNIMVSGSLTDKPVLVSPVNQASLSGAMTFTLDWLATSSADEYVVQLDTDSLFTSPAKIEYTKTYLGSSSTDTDTEQDISGIASGTYFWRVGRQVTGAVQQWSDVWKFDYSSITGVEDILESGAFSFQLFPNPTTGELNFKTDFTERDAAELTVRDISGRVIFIENFQVNSGGQTFSRDFSGLANGLYLVELRTEKQGAVSNKFLITR